MRLTTDLDGLIFEPNPQKVDFWTDGSPDGLAPYGRCTDS